MDNYHVNFHSQNISGVVQSRRASEPPPRTGRTTRNDANLDGSASNTCNTSTTQLDSNNRVGSNTSSSLKQWRFEPVQFRPNSSVPLSATEIRRSQMEQRQISGVFVSHWVSSDSRSRARSSSNSTSPLSSTTLPFTESTSPTRSTTIFEEKDEEILYQKMYEELVGKEQAQHQLQQRDKTVVKKNRQSISLHDILNSN